MQLFATYQFKAAFSQQPQVGVWVERKFFDWKSSGQNNPVIFGRDVADLRPNFQNLRHVHIVPSRQDDLVNWLRKAKHPSYTTYDLTSDRFVLYAEHASGDCLLIDYFTDPGAHMRLTKYYGDVQDNFVWDLKLPLGHSVCEITKKIA